MAGFEVDHVADQPGGGGDRDAFGGGDFEGEELADESAAVGADADRSFTADDVVFVGSGPGVFGGQFGQCPHFFGVGLVA